MVVEQLVYPGVHARRDRAVGGQQGQVRHPAHEQQRLDVVTQRQFLRRCFQADRRGDVGQDVIPGEEQPGLGIGEHHVAAGMPRGRDRLERAAAKVEDRARGDPLVRLLVPVVTGRRPHPGLRHLLHQGLGASPDQPFGLRRHRESILAEQPVKRVLLVRAERDLHPEDPAQADRLRVVIPVNMGHEEPADISEPRADPRQRALELVLGRLQHPAGVDHRQAVGGLDGVGVHGPEPVERERQRDPVDPRNDLMRAFLQPREPVAAGCRGRRSRAAGSGIRR